MDKVMMAARWIWVIGISFMVLALGTQGAAAHPEHALDDAAIIAIFDQANSVDIEAGKIGRQRGTTAEIRELAKMVENDHTAVRQMGRDLAKKIGLPLNTNAGLGEYAKTLKTLESKSGADFDKAYIAHELKFHQSVIDAIKTSLLPAIKNPEFADLVRKVLPGFEHHLAATRAVANKMGMQ